MQNTVSNIPCPPNDPIYSYAPGSPERALLEEALQQAGSEQVTIPVVIGGQRIETGKTGSCIEPHDHGHVLATYHKAGPAEVALAIEASIEAKAEWEALPATARASVFLKAAELLRTKYRYRLNAVTMLSQSKNAYQAEIDSACELIDFWRFNAYYMQELYAQQPDYSPVGMLNFLEHRPLEGFVFAVSPFNFTSIAGNLPTAPALMGNTVLWKPSRNAVYSSYVIMQILEEAGLPPGVINFIPGDSGDIGDPVFESEHFAGLHFTGSTSVFQKMWQQIGNNISGYRAYPRIVGETGGKDFVFAHESADVEALVVALVRGAFEYQGQKCSAASRAYIPASLWPAVKQGLVDTLATVTMGPVQDFSNFVNAVIDRGSFDKCQRYIEQARVASDAEIVCGGACDDSVGYFVQPTVIRAEDPCYASMLDEIFGPILTIHVYADEEMETALESCNSSSMYALTGAVFAKDRRVIQSLFDALRHAAGNFYINDKPTGAVVGQQPFGGGRGSGTNDKAGSILNLQRWVSPRTVKETFNPPTDYRYPFMG
ncbi:MAG: L-glutamate gamma-semialdehyde dehydrogenase [Verrucomicrobia bacterium]|jgi:1-pyrroline-5-carboxylate dehydrogenase|nr:L-glutamate gamma-semialdehyde dehydrogenase [Verrucomicrobiota bacterium]MBT7698903.1 L-glutamate gamma-semialdehyde dehydrogenase [Verrucomicrobiota bacterium]